MAPFLFALQLFADESTVGALVETAHDLGAVEARLETLSQTVAANDSTISALRADVDYLRERVGALQSNVDALEIVEAEEAEEETPKAESTSATQEAPAPPEVRAQNQPRRDGIIAKLHRLVG